MDNLSLQDAVQQYVHTRKMRKKDFARMIGISPMALSNWLGGRTTISPNVLVRIEGLLSSKRI